MTLDELIKTLEAHDPNKVVREGFADPHSYRGYYEQLAFQPCYNITVGEMLANARSARGTTYEGWKGGEFTMNGYTDCWLSYEGQASDEPITERLLKYMLGDPAPVLPQRGDAVATWLKAWRDEFSQGHDPQWDVIDNLLNDYRLHADTGTLLGEHVCEQHCDCGQAGAVNT